jgi:high-affinity nickel-transport protein
MSPAAVLALGFFLGMKHATDADHVVAVSTIVSRERTLRAAAPIGVLWGLGHTLTILLVGGAILLFGFVISPRLGLGMEFSVALMLVLLGALTVRSVLRDTLSVARVHGHGPLHDHSHAVDPESRHHARPRLVRPLIVGIVHGLAGSAAVALLVLGTIRDPIWSVAYLVIFGIGTIAGMLLVTVALAMPLVLTVRRFDRVHRALGLASGILSVVLGLLLAHEIGFVQGLFTEHPTWSPH